MVKLYDVNRSSAHLTPLTQCPGTIVMTRQFPKPGDRFHIIVIDDPRTPSSRVKVDIPEIECRQSHICLIDPPHPLLLVALDCLKDRESVLVKRRIWSTIKVKGRKEISLHKIKF